MMVLRHIGLGQTPPSATIVHPDDEDAHDRDIDREREERIVVGGGGAAIPMDLSNKHSGAVRSPASHHHEIIVPRHLKLNNNNNNNNSNKNLNNSIISSNNNNNNNNIGKKPLSTIFPSPPVNNNNNNNNSKRSALGKDTNILNTIVGRPHSSPSDLLNTNSLRWRGNGGSGVGGTAEDDASYSSPDSGLHRDSPGEDEDALIMMHSGNDGRSSSSPPGLLRSRQSLIPLSLIRARYNHTSSRHPNNRSQQQQQENQKRDDDEDGDRNGDDDDDDEEDEDNDRDLNMDHQRGGGGSGMGGEDDEDCHLPGSGKSSTTSSQSHHRIHHVRKDPHQVQTKRARLEEMVSHIKRTTTSPPSDRRKRRHSGDYEGDDGSSSGGHGTSGDEIGEDLRPTDLRRSGNNNNHHHLNNNNNNNNKKKNNKNNNNSINHINSNNHLNNKNSFGGVLHHHHHRKSSRPTAISPEQHSNSNSSPIPPHLQGLNLNLKNMPFSIAANRSLFQRSSSPDNDHDNDNELDNEPCNLVCNNNSNSGSAKNLSSGGAFPLTMPDISHFIDGKGGGGIPPGLLGSLAAAGGIPGLGGAPGGGGGMIPNLNNLKNFNPQQPLSPSDASKLYGMDPEAYQQHMMQLQLTSAMMAGAGDPNGLLKGLSMGQYPPWLYLFAPYSQLLHSFQAQEMLRQYAMQSQNPTISQGEKSPTILRSNLGCGSPVSPASVSEGGGLGIDSDGSVVGQSTGGNGNGKRAPRAMTGRHVRTGTGASPQTLLTLRQKIEERQRLKAAQQRHDIMLQSHANSNHSSTKGKNSKFMKKFKK